MPSDPNSIKEAFLKRPQFGANRRDIAHIHRDGFNPALHRQTINHPNAPIPGNVVIAAYAISRKSTGDAFQFATAGHAAKQKERRRACQVQSTDARRL